MALNILLCCNSLPGDLKVCVCLYKYHAASTTCSDSFDRDELRLGVSKPHARQITSKTETMNIKSFGLLCVLIVVSHMLLANCERQKERKKGRQGIEDGRKNQTESNQGDEKGRKSKGGKSSPKGKFKTKENAECTWAVTDRNAATVHVECKHNDSEFWCEFSGDPSACPQHAANQKAFWKQISRSLKKEKQICQDPKSVLKSKICRKGPRSAHLKLTRSSLLTSVGLAKGIAIHHTKEVVQTPAAASVTEKKLEHSPQDCVEDIDYIDQKKVAEEYCPEGLLSLCNFFITMVQDKKC
ncbi:fibroblast growth factor-binding protein 1 [Patagioenas fasciata monilis]|uniref:Fibroblast growth factor-binding protein 1 n=1 Tax=Patagioenas fasciata monilis TaxID=372326 RepID=A0A1V4JFL9_PATFA|nr:fibroblast growth factor-binding protein 1 [Patagioenas fasciata monilis]